MTIHHRLKCITKACHQGTTSRGALRTGRYNLHWAVNTGPVEELLEELEDQISGGHVELPVPHWYKVVDALHDPKSGLSNMYNLPMQKMVVIKHRQYSVVLRWEITHPHPCEMD